MNTSLRICLLVTSLLLIFFLACSGGGSDSSSSETSPGPTGKFNVALGITPYDPKDFNSFLQTFGEIKELGATAQFIQGAKWSVICGGNSGFKSDYSGVEVQLRPVLDRDMDLFYSLDFTVSNNRSVINRPAACALASNDFRFSNQHVSAAYVSEVTYIAETYRPKYFAIGVEVEGFLQPASTQERSAFIDAYQRAYQAVKAVRSDAVVFVYFQYENLAILHSYWESVRALLPLVDAYGFSSYPQALQQSGLFASSAALTADYYDKIEENFDANKPLVFAELGATVATTKIYNPGPNPTQDQELFVRNFFSAVSDKHVLLITWMFYHDLDYTLGGTNNSDFAKFFSGMGLKPDRYGPASSITGRGAYEAFVAGAR